MMLGRQGWSGSAGSHELSSRSGGERDIGLVSTSGPGLDPEQFPTINKLILFQPQKRYHAGRSILLNVVVKGMQYGEQGT